MPSLAFSLPSLRKAMPHPRHWPGTIVLALLAALYLVAGLSLALEDTADGRAAARPAPLLPGMPAAADPAPVPPAPEPLAFRDMTPAQATLYNAAVPVADGPVPAARPFVFHPASDADRLRALDCLTAAVYYEAAVEPTEGQRAVAQVVLNRVRHPAFPKTVCGVVFEGSDRATGCQFTFTCDGSLARPPSEAGWARARKVAEEALAGKVYQPVGYATHYHTYWVVPYWSATLAKLANVGAHIFYRWEGGWGRPAAFRYAATGAEPAIASLGHAAPAAEGTEASEDGPDAPAVLTAVAGSDLATPADFKGRPVVRRYQPLREESAAKRRAELAGSDVPQSLRWALTGDAKAVEGALSGVRMKAQQGPSTQAREESAAIPAAGQP